jgi:hypothetical protein
MILNSEGTQAISSLGWVDTGALWIYSSGKGSPGKVVLSDAKYITVLSGKKDFFVAVHNWDGARLEITAHHHSKPGQIICRASVQRKAPQAQAELTVVFEGDTSVWSHLPEAYTAFVSGRFRLIRITADEYDAVQEFEWFDNSYDKGYQGIVGVTEIPDSRNLIISIQRDSQPVLYDPTTKRAVRRLTLAGRRGNPEFLLRATANEFWVSDYDFIVKLDAKTLAVKQSLQVQGGIPGGVAFIGNFCFDREEKMCVIARPFSHDALVLEADSMRELSTVKLPGKPLDIGLLSDGTLIVRDWKTGDFTSAKLKQIKPFWQW